MLAFVVICAIVGGVFGSETCSPGKFYVRCRHHIIFERINAIEGVPNEEELISICPYMLEFSQCLSDIAKDCPLDEESLAATALIEKQQKVLEDLCNEDTSLHKNYVANAECYKTLKLEGQYCSDSANSAYLGYKLFLEVVYPEKLEDPTEAERRRMCMTKSYMMACIAEKVQKKCGDFAVSTMLEMVNRTQYLREFCTSSLVYEMQTTFLEILGLESDDQDIYDNAFSFIKK